MLTSKNQALLLTKVKKEDGFTLVELITVMVIITILVGIAVAVYSDVSRKPANEAHNANTRTLISAVHMVFSEHGSDCFGVKDDGDKFLVWGKDNNDSAEGDDGPGWQDYLQEWPTVPPESDCDGDYEVHLEYPGPKVIVKTTE